MSQKVTLEKIWSTNDNDIINTLLESNPNIFSETSQFPNGYLKMYISKMYHHFGILTTSQNFIVNDPNFENNFTSENLFKSYINSKTKFTLQYIYEMDLQQINFILKSNGYTSKENLKPNVAVIFYNNELLDSQDFKYVQDQNFFCNMEILLLLDDVTDVRKSLDQLMIEPKKYNKNPSSREDIIDQQNREYEEMLIEKLKMEQLKKEEMEKLLEIKRQKEIQLENERLEQIEIEKEKNDPNLRKQRIRDSWAQK